MCSFPLSLLSPPSEVLHELAGTAVRHYCCVFAPADRVLMEGSKDSSSMKSYESFGLHVSHVPQLNEHLSNRH